MPFKKCSLKYYRGTKSDLQFAKYVMQNSTSLQSMEISSVSSNPFVALKELALCPRKSTLCELSFNLHVGSICHLRSALSNITEAQKVTYSLQNMLCRIPHLCSPWKLVVFHLIPLLR